MKSNKEFYVVYYLQGGYWNMINSCLNPSYTEVDAEKQIELLNKAGYPALKIKESELKNGGYFVSSFECNSEKEMKHYYDLAHKNCFPYGNPLKQS